MKKLWLFLPLLVVFAACSATPTVSPTPTVSAVPTTDAGTSNLEVILANSRHVVGDNRFPVGVILDGHSLTDAQVHLKFFDLTSGQPVFKSESDAPYFGDNLVQAGVYVTHATFDKEGDWGVEATVTENGRTLEPKRIAFNVLPQDPSPGVGDDAPRTKNPTLADVNGDRTKISSAVEDDSILHRISIAEAVTNGKPTVILFATPKFCTTRTCGPSHQVVMSLAQNYADKVNFVHVEVYKNFETFEPADAMAEWNLKTERGSFSWTPTAKL